MRRIPELNPKTADGQETLFDTHRHHAFFFTTVDAVVLDTVAADKTHRINALIEPVNADRKDRESNWAPAAGPRSRHPRMSACVRFPMLHVEPRLILRLDELEADLITRRERAEMEGWKDEIDGLDSTLVHLRDKRGRALRLWNQPHHRLSTG